MKIKIFLKILSFIIVAYSLYYNIITVNSSETNISLSALIANNIANAEEVPVPGCHWTSIYADTCISGVYNIHKCKPGYEGDCVIDI